MPEQVLLRRAGDLLEVEIQHIEKYLMDLAMERKIVLKEGENDRRVYPSNYYYMELNTAKMLHDLNISSDISEAAVLRRLQAIEKIWTWPLDERQRTAWWRQ